jgi:hypothetical protein
MRPWSGAERKTLEVGLRSADAFTLRRCQSLLASTRGKNAYQIVQRAASSASRSSSDRERTKTGGFMTGTMAHNQEPALNEQKGICGVILGRPQRMQICGRESCSCSRTSPPGSIRATGQRGRVAAFSRFCATWVHARPAEIFVR